MPKRFDVHEEWAIKQLTPVIELSNYSRDALPGSVVKKVKDAITILKKRRKDVLAKAQEGYGERG